MPNTNKRIDSKKDVEEFLESLKSILNSDTFDITTDLDILPKKKNEAPNDPNTTMNTLAALNFDSTDVCNELKTLTISEYAETMTDSQDASLPPFFVFYRTIQTRDVYIKVKIRDKTSGKVFCVSFHFTKYPKPTQLPYAQ